MPSFSGLSQDEVDSLLAGVDKPARYTGGEANSIVKPVARARLVLCFADLYEIAESFLGFKILYDVVNKHLGFAAERAHAVAPDLEERMRRSGTPLWSLESRRPLCDFDAIGFTLQYELSYPTMLAMLELGGVTVRAETRAQGEPFVLGGGAGAFNPEPVAPFFDAFLLGDGEEAILAMLEVIASGREQGSPRAAILDELAKLPGVYVPAHFEVAYDGLAVTSITRRPGAPASATDSRHGTPRVQRTLVADLDAVAYPTRQIVPNVHPIHDRVTVEIQRGCSQGCRFCQAGMVQRPTRQRSPDNVLRFAGCALAETGADDVGLLSLSAGDYAPIHDVLGGLVALTSERGVSISLPSMRTETMTEEMAAQVNAVTRGGFTLAPEAGSERLRRVINKTNSEADLLAAVSAAVAGGARSVKLYFMIGLPTETDADVEAIVGLAQRARAAGRRVNRAMQVTVSASTFVPKPHTPFQWEAQIGMVETQRKQEQLRDRLRAARITFRWHEPGQSFVEGVLSRGDRRLAPALEALAKAGSRLDGWSDHFDFGRWRRLFKEHLLPHGLTPEDYLKGRDEERLLAWDHLDAGLLKKFLRRDRQRAYAEGPLDDCALAGGCHACGGCDLGDPYLARRAMAERRRELVPRLHAARPAPQSPDAEPSARRASPPSTPTPTSASISTPLDANEAPAEPAAPLASPPPVRSKLRLRYTKVGPAVHLSQLDAIDLVLRALRMARVPVVYSQGFHKRPRVSFSPACPTGIDSHAEYVDILCEGAPDAEAVACAMAPLFSHGMRIVAAEAFSPKSPAVSERLVATHYSARPRAAADQPAWQSAVAAFLAESARWVRIERKGTARDFDLHGDVRGVRFDAEGRLLFAVDFHLDGSLKPSEVLTAILGADAAARAKICKEELELGEAPRTRQRRDASGAAVLDLRPFAGRPTASDAQTTNATVPYAE